MKKLIIILLSIIFICFTPSDIKIKDIDNILKYEWKTDAKIDVCSSPLFFKSIIIPSFELEYAIEANSGKKLYYKNKFVKHWFKKNFQDSLIVFRSSKKIKVLNLYKGKIIFEYNRDYVPPPCNNPGILKKNILHFAINDSIFCAFDIFTNKKRWNINLKKPIFDYPIFIDKKIYVFNGEWLSCIDSNGKVIKEINTGLLLSNPLVYNKNIVVLTENNGLIKISSEYLEKKIIYNKFTNLINEYHKIQIINEDVLIQNFDFYSINIAKKNITWKNNQLSSINTYQYTLFNNLILTELFDNEIDCKVCINVNDGKICFKNREFPIVNETQRILHYNVFTFADTIWNNMIFASGIDTIYAFKILNE